MGLLVNGKWVADQPAGPGAHQNKLGTEEFPFDPETTAPGRYHLYVSRSCPFAERAVIARELKGLSPLITLSLVNPRNTDDGWSFAPSPFDKAGNEESVGDKALGKQLLRDVYTAADPEYTGRVTVPLLIDTKPGNHKLGGSGSVRIVSNESADIVNLFDNVGKSGPKLGELDGYKENADIIKRFSSQVGGLVYGAGRAKTQEDYDEATQNLFRLFGEADKLLASQKFLGGNDISVADVLTFPFLARFDSVWVIAFRISAARLSDYKHLDLYFRRLYQTPAFKSAVYLDQIRYAIFSPSFAKSVPLNTAIIPALPKLDWEVPVN